MGVLDDRDERGAREEHALPPEGDETDAGSEGCGDGIEGCGEPAHVPSADTDPTSAPATDDAPAAGVDPAAADGEPAPAPAPQAPAPDGEPADAPSPDEEPGHAQARATAILVAGEQPTEVVPRADASAVGPDVDAGPDAAGATPSRLDVRALLARMPRWVPAVAVAVVAALAVAAVVLTQVLPPALTDERILSDLDAPSIGAGDLTDSVYASNTGYRIEEERVVSVEGNGADAKVATAEATFVNDSFRVTVSATVDYELAGREWVSHGATVTGVKATPVAGVSGDAVVADMDTLLAEGGSRDGVSLEGIYSGGAFEAGRSTLEGDGDGATSTIEVSARRTRSLYEYSGTITATFEFHEGRASSDAGSWELVSVSADDAAYERSRASVLGEWHGTLETSATSNFILDAGRCWAGESEPLSLEVTSFDPDNGQMTCDLTFVSHNHGGLGSDAVETDGDAVVELSGVTVLLDPETYEGTWTQPTGDRSQGAYRLEFRNADGVWKVVVASGVAGSDGLIPFGYTTFTDTYVLERA